MGRPSPRKYSSEELAAFEREHGITLPEAYREYLMKVGGGGTAKVSLLEDWCQPESAGSMPEGFLRTPFPHAGAWDDPTREGYFDVRHAVGSMRIVDVGCEEYLLLVLSGPERGNVWVDARASASKGIYPHVTRFLRRRVTIGDLVG